MHKWHELRECLRARHFLASLLLHLHLWPFLLYLVRELCGFKTKKKEKWFYPSPRPKPIRHTRHGGTPFGGRGWVVEWEPLSPVMRASPSTCRVLIIDWHVRGMCHCLWYARGLCLCPYVIIPTGFTFLPTQEAEYSFPVHEVLF